MMMSANGKKELMLFDYGITEVGINAEGSNGSGSTTGTVREEDIYLYASRSDGFTWARVMTDLQIDLTPYSKICVEWRNNGMNNVNNRSLIGASTGSSPVRSHLFSTVTSLSRTFDWQVTEHSISHINEPMFVAIAANDEGPTSTATSRIYIRKWWLE
ncbi:hypothetical protein M3689_01135 [Alkalihalophilus marmarensis]|uniref:hypothetical protein n=1 Tax=Alkalihalophilus marmarensis TaxID=521377 RepID=UPI00203E8642|nr:hypothetical protein [Alkalihalophilus marmarensis]MCM3487903.1 hypothetical protein [Alkalihalophilus marmarensis]